MELGPIPGIRAVSLLGPQKAESMLPPRFEIEASARTGDETYSPHSQNADRGLADEDSDPEDGDFVEELEDDDPEPRLFVAPPNAGSKINFLA